MVSINYATREVSCKIVYYGPGLSGKTTNLQYVHRKVPSETKGKLISLATDSDRTLYFDFLPINIGTINGFAAKFQLYTVPGQVYYNATRKLVLRGVDGLVFVADSQADKMDENIESLTNLKENLTEYGYKLEDIPIVIQYNKQDLRGVMTPEQMREVLNPNNWPEFKASATEGYGVFDTLKCILRLVLEKAKSGGTSSSAARTAAPVQASQASGSEWNKSEAAQPAAEAVSVGSSSSTPVATTSQATSDITYSREEVSVAKPITPEEPPAYRPFPGNSTEDEERMLRERQRMAGISGTSSSKPIVDLPFKSSISDTGNDNEEIKDATHPGVPRMEPSRKVEWPRKKRSFFKRLFGLK